MDSTVAISVEFVFGPFRLIPSQRLLLREDRQIKLGGKALDLLHLLVLRAGEEVSKSALIGHTWPNVFVEESNLKVHISGLRRALEDTVPQATYIATVAGRGYQFVAKVETQRIPLVEASCAGYSCLPQSRTLVGRQRDIECVARALDFTKLVTLVGPGGVGKTSLAVAIAHAKRNEYPDGVRFIDLSLTNDHSLIPHVIATAIGIRVDTNLQVNTMLERLRNKRSLIVLDNCDRLLRPVAEFAARCIEERISSHFLVTSREALGVFGENVQRVSPLAFPSSRVTCNVDAALSFPSVALFAMRAFETANYRLTEADVQTVITICELLDGVPFAIELAAAKLARLTPIELLDAVKWRLCDLQNDVQSVHARHKTLWAMLDWSYQQLSKQESALFRLLSVYTGVFEWADVAAMARLLAYDPYQTTAALSSLVSKSLVSAEIEGEELRYRLLDTTREYSLDKLARDPLLQLAQTRHAEVMLAIFKRSEEEWSWVDHVTWRTRYQSRTGDLRRALDWCFSSGGDAELGVDLVIAAMPLWNEQSSILEQRYQVDRALSYCTSACVSPQRTAVLAASRAWNMMLAGRLGEDTADAWNSARAYAQLTGDASQELRVIFGHVNFLIWTGRFEEALSQLDNFVHATSQARYQAARVDCERLRAQCELHLGKLARARVKVEQLAADIASGIPQSKITRFKWHSYHGVRGVAAIESWLSGRPECALKIAEEIVTKCGQVGQVMGQSLALAFGAMPLSMWMEETDRLEQYSIILRNNLDKESISIWEPTQRFYAAVIRHERGDRCAVHAMRLAVEQLVRDRLLVHVPMYLAKVAEAHLTLGDVTQADEVADWALALLRETKENCWLPEVLRVKASAVARLGDEGLAKALLFEALQIASSEGAVFFELRLVNDLARMEIVSGKVDGTVEVLSPLNKTSHDKPALRDLQRSPRLLTTGHRGSSVVPMAK